MTRMPPVLLALLTLGSYGCKDDPEDDTTHEEGDVGVAAGEWPAFKRDVQRTGLVDDMTGNMNPTTACVKWSRQVTGLPTRALGGPVIGVVNEKPRVLFATDGLCATDETGCEAKGTGAVWALEGEDGSVVWRTLMPEDSAADPYAPTLTDLDADGLLELLVPSLSVNEIYAYSTMNEGFGRGALQWKTTFGKGERLESIPIVADIDPSDEFPEIIFGSDTGLSGAPASIRVLSANNGVQKSIFEVLGRNDIDLECSDVNRADTSAPASAVVDGKTLVFMGAWNGSLYAFEWLNDALSVYWEDAIPEHPTLGCGLAKVQTAPAVGDIDADGVPDVVYGYMYEGTGAGDLHDRFEEAMLRAVRATDGSELWEELTGDWKSSPSIGELNPALPGLEVAAGRSYGITSRASDGSVSWQLDLAGGDARNRGNRSSPALADVDGDGAVEVVMGIETDDSETNAGLYVFDGASGQVEWTILSGNYQSSQNEYGVASSPAVGDIDADGLLEIVFLSRDGKVYAVDSECPPGSTEPTTPKGKGT